MHAHGADGLIAANDTHVTINWTTLRGRLSSVDGSNLEVIPISKIYEVLLIPATSTMKGCLQFNLIGSEHSLAFEGNWMATLRKDNLNHVVLFNQPAQFEFKALTEHIQKRITLLRKAQPIDGGFGTTAQSIG